MTPKSIRHKLLYIAATLAIAGCQVSNSGSNQASSVAAPKVKADTSSSASSMSFTRAQCKLDLVSGLPAKSRMEVAHGSGAAFEGWAFVKGQPPFSKMLLVLTGTGKKRFVVPVNTGILRNDVAQAFGDSSLATSGFAVTADITDLPSGYYNLSVQAETSNGLALCNLDTSIEVK